MAQAESTRPGAAKQAMKEPQRLFWAALAAPGHHLAALLFIVPFYAILAIAAGQAGRSSGSRSRSWNPFSGARRTTSVAWHDVAGASAFVGPIMVRTVVYVALASLISLLIAYPAAYFVARFAGRRKGLFLILLIAPFWISYMMRMLAWIDLLQTNGYVNKALGWVRRSASRSTGWADWAVHRRARPGLRLHPVPDPGALRGPGPDRPGA